MLLIEYKILAFNIMSSRFIKLGANETFLNPYLT